MQPFFCYSHSAVYSASASKFQASPSHPHSFASLLPLRVLSFIHPAITGIPCFSLQYDILPPTPHIPRLAIRSCLQGLRITQSRNGTLPQVPFSVPLKVFMKVAF